MCFCYVPCYVTIAIVSFCLAHRSEPVTVSKVINAELPGSLKFGQRAINCPDFTICIQAINPFEHCVFSPRIYYFRAVIILDLPALRSNPG